MALARLRGTPLPAAGGSAHSGAVGSARSDEGAEPTLQLAVGREGVGLELSGPLDLGVTRLLRARARMVGVGFPLDVSGGVERFRHRRSTLEQATFTVEHALAERFLQTHATDLIAPGAAEVRIRSNAMERPDDAGETRETRRAIALAPMRIELSTSSAMVAFDVVVAASGTGLTVLAHRPRAIGTDASPTAIIGRFFARLAIAVSGKARGVRIDLADPVGPAIVAAFVSRGARLPVRTGMAVSSLLHDAERWTIDLEREATPVAPSKLFVALDELDRVIGDGDGALSRGETEAARDHYLRALERAPRHRTVLTRLAELDASAGRTEAALVWLREVQKIRARRSVEVDENELGRMLLSGRIHQRLSSVGRARSAYERAALRALEDDEVRLAARAFSRSASLVPDDDPQLLPMLDRALEADPSESEARWRRVRVRVLAGEDAKALQDVQHLEAQARGREARRLMLIQAALVWRDAHRLDRAVSTYERALRYAPEDRTIVAGLGSALLSAGEIGRGTSLLAHALSLPGDEAGVSSIAISLAEALAESVLDLPAAIARLRDLGDDDPRAPYARALEATYRTRLGDEVGAVRAWSTAADLAERRGVDDKDVAPTRALLLSGAARFIEDREVTAAMRLALAAVAISPNDVTARALVQQLGRQERKAALDRAGTDEGSSAGEGSNAGETGEARESVGVPLALPMEDERGDGSATDQVRADDLLARVKANPDDEAAVDELVELLAKLGRDFELFALLQARFDEATDDDRARLAPKQRAVLERMADSAHESGRELEASLYRDAAAAIRR